MPVKAPEPAWAAARKHELTVEFCQQFADLIRDGKTVKIAARSLGIPPATMRYWLEDGERKVAEVYASDVLEMGSVGYTGRLWLAVAEAVAERDGQLLGRIEGRNRFDEVALDSAAAWKLERFDPDEFRPGQKVELTGAPAQRRAELAEGKTSIAAVAAVLLAVGVDLSAELPVVAGGALPAAREVLPASGDDQPAAGRVPLPPA